VGKCGGAVTRVPVSTPPAARGERILELLEIRPDRHAQALARAIVPADLGPFRARLLDGLSTLLVAIAKRTPGLATAAACRLVGVGPGATPIGDDYLAAGGLTVATLGGDAGLPRTTRESWLKAALPDPLAELTTDPSRSMLLDSMTGQVPDPVRPLLDLTVSNDDLSEPLRRVQTIGATTGRAWTSAIGAAALLLGAGGTETGPARDRESEHEPTGDPTR
jgi:hypothetical protein